MAFMSRENVLYCIVCGAPPAAEAGRLVELAKLAGWDACVVTTPLATRFVDLDQLAELSGRPVRHDYKRPGEPDLFPRASALVVAPATFNTINKLAAGIADTLALSLLCEYLALGTPIVVAPSVGPALAHHPQYPRSVRRLRHWGARVLEVRSAPAQGGWMLPWKRIVDELPQLGDGPGAPNPT
jgi:phosphopantothenoylcysteine synthetase/decarboxylase